MTEEELMATAKITVDMKDFARVKELFEAASDALPLIAGDEQERLAAALIAFSKNDGDD